MSINNKIDFNHCLMMPTTNLNKGKQELRKYYYELNVVKAVKVAKLKKS